MPVLSFSSAVAENSTTSTIINEVEVVEYTDDSNEEEEDDTFSVTVSELSKEQEEEIKKEDGLVKDKLQEKEQINNDTMFEEALSSEEGTVGTGYTFTCTCNCPLASKF